MPRVSHGPLYLSVSLPFVSIWEAWLERIVASWSLFDDQEVWNVELGFPFPWRTAQNLKSGLRNDRKGGIGVFQGSLLKPWHLWPFLLASWNLQYPKLILISELPSAFLSPATMTTRYRVECKFSRWPTYRHTPRRPAAAVLLSHCPIVAPPQTTIYTTSMTMRFRPRHTRANHLDQTLSRPIAETNS